MSWYFQAFVLWRLSLAVCCASSESQSSSGRNSASATERRDCGPFSTDVLATLTLLLLVLLNPAASRDMRPTPGVPALTFRAGVSLSFMSLTPPAASWPHALQSSVSVWFVHSGAPVFSLVVHVPGSRSQSALSQVPVRESARSPMQVATASQRPNAVAPSPFHLSSDTCERFHGSPLRTSILITGDVCLWRSRFIFLCLRLILWMIRLVWYLSNLTQGTS